MPAYSFSALNQYETCPKQYYHIRIAKDFKEREWEHRTEGERVHKVLELRLKNKTPLTPDLELVEPICHKIESAPGELFLEQKIALNMALKPVTWFAKDVWVRAIFDVAKVNKHKAVVFDWKTGKPKPGSDQLRLFAAVLMAWQPQVEEVTTGFIWLKNNLVDDDQFVRDKHYMNIWSDYARRFDRIENSIESNIWQAKPSGLCRRHCPVTNCVYWGK